MGVTARARLPRHIAGMPHYVRTHVPGGSFFFTVALLERRRSLLTDHADTLRASFHQVRRKRPFTVDAIVVLPDHLHCIWTLPAGDADYSTRWRLIKAAFSRSLDAGEPLSARRQLKQERGIWQRRFWEHAIRDERDYAAHADYIHYNPVKHGHAARAADWPYSSFRRWVAAGLYPENWAAGDEVQGLDLE
ncbi:MAG: hypothetical protein JWQ90_2879 [Hydrocarboniphaga sp.]|nr:hypothetical protein [Hydrocarboniphaga sp.]